MNNDTRQRALGRFAGVFAILALVWSASAAAQSSPQGVLEEHDELLQRCSNRTLMGDYGVTIEGIITDQGNAPLRTLSLQRFFGDGNLTTRDHVVLNGQPPEVEWRVSTGTYTVNADCTGSASINVAPGFPPLGYHFLIVSKGQKIFLVVDGGAINGTGNKVR